MLVGNAVSTAEEIPVEDECVAHRPALTGSRNSSVQCSWLHSLMLPDFGADKAVGRNPVPDGQTLVVSVQLLALVVPCGRRILEHIVPDCSPKMRTRNYLTEDGVAEGSPFVTENTFGSIMALVSGSFSRRPTGR